MKERLQKIISASGLMSRRAAEELIAAGKVSVNGVTASLGDKAEAETDKILVDGKGLPSDRRGYNHVGRSKGFRDQSQDDGVENSPRSLFCRRGNRR